MGWLLRVLLEISSNVTALLTRAVQILDMERKNNNLLKSILEEDKNTQSSIQQLLLIQQSFGIKLDKIIKLLEPPLAVKFIATIIANNPQGEIVMPKGKLGASADININDNGTATINVTFQDADGVTVPAPSGVQVSYGPASDENPGPGSFTLTPSADTLSCQVAVVQPPPQPLHTGVTFTVTVASGLAGQTGPVSVQTNPPLDVVPGPAASFVAAVSEP